ncbi:MAG: D-aminoacyl-tRNA deacylase [Candidatus Hodarchaeales archaeon]|jgi:D-aminoacyl-tRNA deacylase
MNNERSLQIQLLASKVDNAGMNILKFIKSPYKENTIVIEGESIFADEELSSSIKSTESSLIFLSRHRAKSLRPSLTLHPIGNFSKAEFGGKDSILIHCNSFIQKQLFLNINNLHTSGEYDLMFEYEISVEVTHHGPYTPNSLTYIEVGSSEDQWKDLEACRLIADAVNLTDFNTLSDQKTWISSIGFGGNHYPQKFTKQMRESDYAIGHMCAKYAIPFLTKELLEQMIQKTFPKPEIALFDKKSMKRKQLIRSWLAESDLEIILI